ncbi:hypothetical protein EFU50_07940 [Vibrio cholerae]|nr:hypothetical protein [Vibrio cholerae]EGR0586725.1 hypothetical protein [Vibrio cholerae]EGR1110081.1 hypothetical protein [Vibrio cholerae]EGR1135157.1 hypothetical protein [Vibrio cholerae]EGR1139159.1 hypothetical protein [Vibrio cholerae]
MCCIKNCIFQILNYTHIAQSEQTIRKIKMANTMLGGWGLFHELSNEDKAAFASGIEGFVGVSYKPVAVATQVVAGCNYAFFCNAEMVYPGSQPYPAMVHMFKDLEGKVGITHIQRLDY